MTQLWPTDAGLPLATAFGAGAGFDGERLAVDDPATGENVGWVQLTTTAGVDAAVAQAEAAFPDWAATSAHRRAELMLEGAAAIEAAVPELTQMIIAEVGKASHEARVDASGAVHLIRTFAGLADEAAAITELTGQPGAGTADEVLLHRVPVGPVAVITPWNTPVFLTMNCVGPALAAGCTVVVKPAEAAPLSVTAALRLLADALPPGVLQVVQGRGADVGSALTSHPKVRGVLFVGGIVAGREVLRSAADTITKVSLELGGNDPALVLDDARLDDEQLRELVAGSYALSGQICFNIKRIYVHRSRYDEFVEKFTAMVDQLVIGPGGAPGVHLGPLTTAGGFANAQRLLAAARAAGATVHEGGVFAEGADPDRGRYIRPTVVTDIAADHELVLTEQFAPIIPIIPVDSDEQAIAEANRTEYGLCSSVWSEDPERARAVALQIQAGNTHINAHRVGAAPPIVPFGGFKQSGLGRNRGMHAIAECTEEHAIARYTNPAQQLPGIEPWQDLTLSR